MDIHPSIPDRIAAVDKRDFVNDYVLGYNAGEGVRPVINLLKTAISE